MDAILFRIWLQHVTSKLIVSGIFLLWIVTASAQQNVFREPNKFYSPQQVSTLPAMDLETLDSSIFNTSALANKTVYVDFWFTACPPCIKEIPFAKQLQAYFASDTNVVFLNICIENLDRKEVWKKMVKEKAIQGINVFYARNRPQKINLLRQFSIVDYPTYVIIHKLKVLGNAPSPSEKGWVHWAIYQATKNIPVSTSYALLINKHKSANDYLSQNWPLIDATATP